jgi:hypothetical protein
LLYPRLETPLGHANYEVIKTYVNGTLQQTNLYHNGKSVNSLTDFPGVHQTVPVPVQSGYTIVQDSHAATSVNGAPPNIIDTSTHLMHYAPSGELLDDHTIHNGFDVNNIAPSGPAHTWNITAAGIVPDSKALDHVSEIMKHALSSVTDGFHVDALSPVFHGIADFSSPLFAHSLATAQSVISHVPLVPVIIIIPVFENALRFYGKDIKAAVSDFPKRGLMAAQSVSTKLGLFCR